MKWLADFSFFLIEEGEKLKALRNKVDMQFFKSSNESDYGDFRVVNSAALAI